MDRDMKEQVEQALCAPVLLNGPIDGQLDLTDLASSRLRYAGVRTVLQLVSMTERDLLDIRRFGPGCLRSVKEALAQEGLRLKSEGV